MASREKNARDCIRSGLISVSLSSWQISLASGDKLAISMLSTGKILLFCSKTVSLRFMKSSRNTPSTPYFAPYTFPISSRSKASLITPERLALITAVGPPDCATNKFFFMFSLSICFFLQNYTPTITLTYSFKYRSKYPKGKGGDAKGFTARLVRRIGLSSANARFRFNFPQSLH